MHKHTEGDMFEDWKNELEGFEPSFDEAAWSDMKVRLDDAKSRLLWYFRYDHAALTLLLFLVGGVYFDFSTHSIPADYAAVDGEVFSARGHGLTFGAGGHSSQMGGLSFVAPSPQVPAGHVDTPVQGDGDLASDMGGSVPVTTSDVVGAEVLDEEIIAGRPSWPRKRLGYLPIIISPPSHSLPFIQPDTAQVDANNNRFFLGVTGLQLLNYHFGHEFDQTNYGLGLEMDIPIGNKWAFNTGIQKVEMSTKSIVSKYVDYEATPKDGVDIPTQEGDTYHFEGMVEYVTRSKIRMLELPMNLSFHTNPKKASSLFFSAGVISHMVVSEQHQFQISQYSELNRESGVMQHRFWGIHAMDEQLTNRSELSLMSAGMVSVGVRHRLGEGSVLDIKAFARKPLALFGKYQVPINTVGLSLSLKFEAGRASN